MFGDFWFFCKPTEEQNQSKGNEGKIKGKNKGTDTKESKDTKGKTKGKKKGTDKKESKDTKGKIKGKNNKNY